MTRTLASATAVVAVTLSLAACIGPPEYADREPRIRSVVVEFDEQSHADQSSFVSVEKRLAPVAETTGEPPLPLPEPSEVEIIPFDPATPMRFTSIRTRAERALQSGDHRAAAHLYIEWLHADPTDANAWYNLACLEALQGHEQRALTAFTNSLHNGFDQFEHARSDPDLASLREDSRFEEQLGNAERRQRSRMPVDLVRHHITTETVGTYVVLRPAQFNPGQTYPICVLLHGSGSDEIGHSRIAETLGRGDVIYVAPRALQAHVGATLSRGEAGWAVWPPEDVDKETGILPMTLHVDWIFRCIDDVAKRYPVDASKVAIWGHSQGAAAAFSCAALRPERVETVCAYAGYYPDTEVTDERVEAMVAAGVQIHLLHSKDDPVVPPENTREMADRLIAAGGDLDLVWYATGGHGLTDAVRDRSRRWLRDYAHVFSTR